MELQRVGLFGKNFEGLVKMSEEETPNPVGTLHGDMLREIFSHFNLRDMLSARLTCKKWICQTAGQVRSELLAACRNKVMELVALGFVLDIDLSQGKILDISKSEEEKRSEFIKERMFDIISAQKRAADDAKSLLMESEKDEHYQYTPDTFKSDLFRYYALISESVKAFSSKVNLEVIANQLQSAEEKYLEALQNNLIGESKETSILYENSNKRKIVGDLRLQRNIQEIYRDIIGFSCLNKNLKNLIATVTRLEELRKSALLMEDTEETLEATPVLTVAMLPFIMMSYMKEAMKLKNQPAKTQSLGGLLRGAFDPRMENWTYNVGLDFPLGNWILRKNRVDVAILDEKGKVVPKGMSKTNALLNITRFSLTFPNLLLSNNLEPGKKYRILFVFISTEGLNFYSSEEFTIE